MQILRGDARPKSRREFARCGKAAHLGTGFQYKHALASTGEHLRADEAVVTGANDDGVPRAVHADARPKSAITRRAQLAPGAPMTPPPGCVDDPDRYRLRTGVRYWA